MKYQVVFQSGLKIKQVFDTTREAYDYAFEHHFKAGHYYLADVDDKIVILSRIYTEAPVATIVPVEQVPFEVTNSDDIWFALDQEFLVYFSRWGFNGMKLMSTQDIIEMYKLIVEAEYPFDLFFNEFEWETVRSSLGLTACITAWRIPAEWERPSFLPVYSHIGTFPDYENFEQALTDE